MENCLLCLEFKQEFVSTIAVNSKQWDELKIKNILLKYLWPMSHIGGNSWICQTCWTELYEFHKFYMRIEEVHRNLGLLSIVVEVEEIASNNKHNATKDRAETPANHIEEYPIEVLETGAVELNDFLNESCTNNLLQSDTNEDEKPLFKLELYEESLTSNNLVSKRKRGRPRKNANNNTNIIKKDYERKDTNISGNSSRKVEKRKKAKCNKIHRKEADIDGENSLSNVENLKTDLISTSDETHMSSERHMDFSSESDGEYSEIRSGANTNCSSKSLSNENDKFIADNFKITCHICDIPFETFYKVRKHFEVEHKQRGYIECCNRKFYRRNMLLDHVHYHVNPNYFKCSKCDKSFEDRRRLDLHTKTHDVNNGKNHFCDVCGKGFLILAILNKHKLIHVPEEEKRFECSDCGKKFATNDCRKTHYRYTHLKKYIKICDTCGKAIRDKDVFKRHMMQHEGKSERVSCDVCGLVLTDAKALKRHKEVIHPVGGQKMYTCPICSKTSPNFRAHKLHVQFKHETGYNYKCTICDKKFKKAPSLKEHMASHTGTKLYNCPWCPKTFNSSANMHHHRKRIHPKEWEETSRKRYSGKLPPYFKPPTTTESPESIAPLDTQ